MLLLRFAIHSPTFYLSNRFSTNLIQNSPPSSVSVLDTYHTMSSTKQQWAWCPVSRGMLHTSMAIPISELTSSFIDVETSTNSPPPTDSTSTTTTSISGNEGSSTCGICLSVPLFPAVLPHCSHLFCVPCLLEFIHPKLVQLPVYEGGTVSGGSEGGAVQSSDTLICCPLDRQPIPIYSHALPDGLTFIVPPPPSTTSTASLPPQYLEPLLVRMLECVDADEEATINEVVVDSSSRDNATTATAPGSTRATPFVFSISVVVPSSGGTTSTTRSVHLAAPRRDILQCWASHQVSCIHSPSHGCTVTSIPLQEFLTTHHFTTCANKPVYCPVRGCRYSDLTSVPPANDGKDDVADNNCFFSQEELESHMRDFTTTHFTIMSSQQSALITENTSLQRLVSDLKAESYQTRNDMAALEFQLREQAQHFQAQLGAVQQDFVRLQQVTSSLMLSQSMSPATLSRGPHQTSHHNYSSLFNEMPCTLQSPMRIEHASSCGWWSQSSSTADTPFEVITTKNGEQVCFRKRDTAVQSGVDSVLPTATTTTAALPPGGVEVPPVSCRGWATIASHAMVMLEPTPSSSTGTSSNFSNNVVRIRFVSREGNTTSSSTTAASALHRSRSAPSVVTAAGCGLAATRLMASSTSGGAVPRHEVHSLDDEVLPLSPLTSPPSSAVMDDATTTTTSSTANHNLDSVFQSGAVMIGVMSSSLSPMADGASVVADRHMGRIPGCLAIQSTGFIWNGDTGLCRRHIPLPSTNTSTTSSSLQFSCNNEIFLRLKEGPQLGCVLECAVVVGDSTHLNSSSGVQVVGGCTPPLAGVYSPIAFLSTTPRMLPLAVSLGTALVGVIVDFV